MDLETYIKEHKKELVEEAKAYARDGIDSCCKQYEAIKEESEYFKLKKIYELEVAYYGVYDGDITGMTQERVRASMRRLTALIEEPMKQQPESFEACADDIEAYANEIFDLIPQLRREVRDNCKMLRMLNNRNLFDTLRLERMQRELNAFPQAVRDLADQKAAKLEKLIQSYSYAIRVFDTNLHVNCTTGTVIDLLVEALEALAPEMFQQYQALGSDAPSVWKVLQTDNPSRDVLLLSDFSVYKINQDVGPGCSYNVF